MYVPLNMREAGWRRRSNSSSTRSIEINRAGAVIVSVCISVPRKILWVRATLSVCLPLACSGVYVHPFSSTIGEPAPCFHLSPSFTRNLYIAFGVCLASNAGLHVYIHIYIPTLTFHFCYPHTYEQLQFIPSHFIPPHVISADILEFPRKHAHKHIHWKIRKDSVSLVLQFDHIRIPRAYLIATRTTIIKTTTTPTTTVGKWLQKWDSV